jgi:hypothetical protein
MNIILKNILLIAALLCWMHPVFAQNENPIISAIRKEVDRNKSNLKMEGMAPPLFISYSVLDIYSCSMAASLGGISSFNEFHTRRGIPRVLVGTYMLNTAKVAELRPPASATTSLHDNASGIPITIWRSLDAMYKDAAERYNGYLAVLQQRTRTPEEENLPDFEQMNPANRVLQPAPVDFNKAYWENYLRKASESAVSYPDILNSNVALNMRNVMTYTYNTEGSSYAVPSTFYQLSFTANTRSDDGQDLNHTIRIENATFSQMPNLETFINQCKTMMENLIKLKSAPVIDDAYCGPVLFEGAAVERIFRLAFLNNNRLSASPSIVQLTNNPFNTTQGRGNDFELMLNRKVMSRSITIKSITGQEYYKGQRLNGYYSIDAEGVAPVEELILVENGVLRNLHNGRRPTRRIRNSNGHARFDYNTNTLRVAPGNILITSNQTFSNEELRKKLFEVAMEEDLDYAYIVRQYENGINLMYRVYVDDGREELVRGATISDDSNLRAFRRILGASDKEQISSFGEIQTTVIYPDALLFEEMDITRIPNIEFKRPYIVQKP